MVIEHNIRDIYCAGRKALAEDLLCHLGNDRAVQEALWMTIWSESFVGHDQLPQPFYAYHKWKYRQEAVGFEGGPLRIENIKNKYLRLQTNTSFYLPVCEYRDFNSFYEQLSKKLRRKLRGLIDAFAEEEVQFVPIKTEADVDEFLAMFQTQWPKDAWVNELRPYLWKIYSRLEETGKNRSFMLKDKSGQGVAGLMAYKTELAVNWHLLTRRMGVMDKYAPGVYMVYRALQHFFTEAKEQYVIYGPGDYDWKRRYLGREFPVYRYERLTPRNLIGLAVLWKRLGEEKKKRATANEEE